MIFQKLPSKVSYVLMTLVKEVIRHDCVNLNSLISSMFLNPLMLTAAKSTLDGAILVSTSATTRLQIFCKIILNANLTYFAKYFLKCAFVRKSLPKLSVHLVSDKVSVNLMVYPFE